MKSPECNVLLSTCYGSLYSKVSHRSYVHHEGKGALSVSEWPLKGPLVFSGDSLEANILETAKTSFPPFRNLV